MKRGKGRQLNRLLRKASNGLHALEKIIYSRREKLKTERSLG